MPRSALDTPQSDPTPIFELFRGSFATELLTAAVGSLRVFDRLASGPRDADTLRRELGLAERPFVVLTTALRAMQLLAVDSNGLYGLSELAAEHLVSGRPYDVSGYVGLAADAPGVREMHERLISNRPAGAAEADKGAAFIYREGLESAMEREASARSLTLALAGRAKNVAPYLAQQSPLEGTETLLDLGGGTGIYALALAQRHPRLRPIVFDRPEVLKVARELAAEYGLAHRVEFVEGDMFADPLPACDAVLLSNVLHDWDVPACQQLLARCASVLPRGGRVLVHDVFLNDELDGPLPIALYSAALFTLTEGRAYSALEYRGWLAAAGFDASAPLAPTFIHCGLLTGVKL